MAKTKTKKILLTREDNTALAEILKSRGLSVSELPLISVNLHAEEDELRDVFAEMGHYDWLTFSSVNGVRGFFDKFFKSFDDIRSLGIARIACVGEATARELKKYFLRADVLPEIATAENMAKAMSEYETLENLKVLCIIGNLTGNALFDELEKTNAIVDALEVYKTEIARVERDCEAAADFRKNGADVVVFASTSAVEGFAKNADSLALESGATRPKIVTIGPKTSEAVKKYGMKVAAQAENTTPQALADAVESVL